LKSDNWIRLLLESVRIYRISGAFPVASGQIHSFSKVFRWWEEVGVVLF
jgi:hypothetical protein